MKLNKLIITSETGHFGSPLGYDDRRTYDAPPPSTVIGILQTLYDRTIDNFVFGYTFEYDTKFLDDITIHKRHNEGRLINKRKYVSDICFIELLYNCKLTIYTSIAKDLKMSYILCMGKTDNIARLQLPIQEVGLKNIAGQGFNQYTTKDIGCGRINTHNMKSFYVKQYSSYEHQVKQLRFNKVFDYNKNYDNEEEQNIFLWEMKDGVVQPYD